MTESESGNQTAMDIKADPPIVEAPSQIEAAATYHLGNRLFVHAIEKLPNGDYMAYLGVVRPYDTSAAIDDPELSFVNYAPIGAIRPRPRDGGEGFVLDLPDRDALHRACRTRRRYEGDHRAALVPGLTNTLTDRRELHYEKYSEYEPDEGFDNISELKLDDLEMFDYGFHRGMAKMAGLLDRRVADHLRGPYRGNQRWSKHDTRGVHDVE